MSNGTLSQIPIKKIILIVILLVAILLVATHSIVIVETPESSNASVSKTATETHYTGDGTKQIKVVGVGKWYVSARNGTEVSGKIIRTKPFLFPSVVRLTPDAQYQSKKITSLGDRCVLFDDPVKDVTTTSSCVGPSQTVNNIYSDKTQQSITSGADISQTAPVQGGFLYILQPPGGESTEYTVGVYNASSQQASTLLEKISLATAPVIVSDTETGRADGLLLGNKYVPLDNIYAKKQEGFNVVRAQSSRQSMTLAKQYKNKLYLYTGTSSDVLGDTSLKPLSKLTISTYSTQDGRAGEGIEISNRYVFSDFTVLNSETLGFIGTLYSSSKPVLCTYTAKITCSEPWETSDNITNIVATKDGIAYVANGKVWSYSQESNSTKLLYDSVKLQVTSVNRIGNLLYVSAINSGSLNSDQIYNLVLDESAPATNKSRLEAYLPSSLSGNDQVFADTHRGTIIVTNLAGKSLTNTTIKQQVEALGVDPSITSSVSISITRPEVNPPTSPIVLPFAERVSED